MNKYSFAEFLAPAELSDSFPSIGTSRGIKRHQPAKKERTGFHLFLHSSPLLFLFYFFFIFFYFFWVNDPVNVHDLSKIESRFEKTRKKSIVSSRKSALHCSFSFFLFYFVFRRKDETRYGDKRIIPGKSQ